MEYVSISCNNDNINNVCITLDGVEECKCVIMRMKKKEKRRDVRNCKERDRVREARGTRAWAS